VKTCSRGLQILHATARPMVGKLQPKSAKKEQKKLAREQSNPFIQIQTSDPVLSQSTVIAGWKSNYASVQGVSQASGAIFMGEMRLDANKRKLKTGTYKETVVWRKQR
jgi:hypothetical protein